MRYENNGASIKMKITSDYIITVVYNFTQNNDCHLTLYINRADVDILDEIEKQVVILEKHGVKANITKMIEDMAIAGKFVPYIERYERMMNALDIGNDILECAELDAHD